MIAYKLYPSLPGWRASALTSSSPARPTTTQDVPWSCLHLTQGCAGPALAWWWRASPLLLLLFQWGKELAAAVTHCCGVSCLGTPDSETWAIFARENFSSAHATMVSSEGSPQRGTSIDHGYLPKEVGELVQSWLPQETGAEQTQLVPSNSHTPN